MNISLWFEEAPLSFSHFHLLMNASYGMQISFLNRKCFCYNREIKIQPIDACKKGFFIRNCLSLVYKIRKPPMDEYRKVFYQKLLVLDVQEIKIQPIDACREACFIRNCLSYVCKKTTYWHMEIGLLSRKCLSFIRGIRIQLINACRQFFYQKMLVLCLQNKKTTYECREVLLSVTVVQGLLNKKTTY